MQTYIGVDLHRQFFVVHVEDETGNLLFKERYDNSLDNIESLSHQFPSSKVVVEATRNWQWMVEGFRSVGCQVIMAHPFRTKAIAAARIKTDSVDAATLCHLLRANLIPEAYTATRDEVEQRSLSRGRRSLVHDQTLLKNRIHAEVAKYNLSFEGSDLFGTGGRSWLKQQPLPESTRLIVESYLSLLDSTMEQIEMLTTTITQKSSDDPRAKLLNTIPGIGVTTAFLLSSEIGDITRFKSAKHFASYFGLVPRLSQSGEHAYYGRITKTGNTGVRWALVQSAHRLIRYNETWKKWHARIAFRSGKKKAIVAVARKLSTIIYAILKYQLPYTPHPRK